MHACSEPAIHNMTERHVGRSYRHSHVWVVRGWKEGKAEKDRDTK